MFHVVVSFLGSIGQTIAGCGHVEAPDHNSATLSVCRW